MIAPHAPPFKAMQWRARFFRSNGVRAGNVNQVLKDYTYIFARGTLPSALFRTCLILSTSQGRTGTLEKNSKNNSSFHQHVCMLRCPQWKRETAPFHTVMRVEYAVGIHIYSHTSAPAFIRSLQSGWSFNRSHHMGVWGFGIQLVHPIRLRGNKRCVL